LTTDGGYGDIACADFEALKVVYWVVLIYSYFYELCLFIACSNYFQPSVLSSGIFISDSYYYYYYIGFLIDGSLTGAMIFFSGTSLLPS